MFAATVGEVVGGMKVKGIECACVSNASVVGQHIN